MNERDVPEALDAEVEGLMVVEARRGARVVLPFLLPTLYLIWEVLGDATRATPVRVAFGLSLGVVLVRWVVLSMLARGTTTSPSWRARAFTASSWLVSIGFGGIYVAAGPYIGAVRLALSMKVRDFGLHDGLTGLRNRAFVELFTEERAGQIVEQWENSGRRKATPGRSLALLLVDLDHFKKINDKYGHASGDQVLATFAKVARAAVRSGDIVARWGGEEFLVVMEVDDRSVAHEVAERLRAMIATSPVADVSGRAIEVTCSVGACLFPFDPTRPADLTWRETLELADGSLYRAKSTGRNCTVWAEPDADFTPRQLLEIERDNDAETLVFRKAA